MVPAWALPVRGEAQVRTGGYANTTLRMAEPSVESGLRRSRAACGSNSAVEAPLASCAQVAAEAGSAPSHTTLQHTQARRDVCLLVRELPPLPACAWYHLSARVLAGIAWGELNSPW